MSASVGRVRGVLFLLLHPKRLLALIAAFVTAILYVWIAAVHAVPGVRRRKAALRQARRQRARERERPG
jgi:hypothetical protein